MDRYATEDQYRTDGDHSDTIFVALITLASICIAVLAFNFALDRYTTHFGSPGTLARRAAAEAASSAAAGMQSTALADARAAWGQFGDYLGGMLNPVLSFFSFIALSMALMLQARQVGLSRTELRETRGDRAEAQQDAKAQLEPARSLVAAQLRTARAQERAAQLFAKQLAEASAAARAQEQSALALMHQARIGTLSAQLHQAEILERKKFEHKMEVWASYRAQVPAYQAADNEHRAAVETVERLRGAIANAPT